jgi:hypothetical protein
MILNIITFLFIYIKFVKNFRLILLNSSINIEVKYVLSCSVNIFTNISSFISQMDKNIIFNI